MDIILRLLILALDIYFWIIIATVVVSWLIVFDVLNTRHRGVYKFCQLLNRATDPLVQRLRRVIPPLGGIDLTPMVIIFGIYLLQELLYSLLWQVRG